MMNGIMGIPVFIPRNFVLILLFLLLISCDASDESMLYMRCSWNVEYKEHILYMHASINRDPQREHAGNKRDPQRYDCVSIIVTIEMLS